MKAAVAVSRVIVACLMIPSSVGAGEQCRKSSRCKSDEVPRDGQCCRPSDEKPPAPPPRRSPVPARQPKGAVLPDFDESTAKTHGIGQFPKTCLLEPDGLTATVTVRRKRGPESYGGCCVENDRPIRVTQHSRASVRLEITGTEDDVQAKVEESNNEGQDFIYHGRVERGSRTLPSKELGLDEIKRFCVVVAGTGAAEHKTTVVVRKVFIEKPTAKTPPK